MADSDFQHAPRYSGLTSQQVLDSRNQHGVNLVTPPPRDPWWKLYLEKFEDPIIRILMVAAAVAIGVGLADGHYAEGAGILVAILLATTLAFFNEFRASREFDILNRVNDEVPVKVIRNGEFTAVQRRDLVVGDVILVEQGEEIPADSEVLEAVSIQVDESRLTGESMPVAKYPAEGEERSESGLAYPRHLLLRSTLVVDGHSLARVLAVGDSTEIGQTARAAAVENEAQTPLNRQLERLSKVIGVFGFMAAGLIFPSLVLRGVVTGEPSLQLSWQQWGFVGVMAGTLLLALVRVWYPILMDARELLGHDAHSPVWLSGRGARGWLHSVGYGVAFFLVALLIGHFTGAIPASPAAWIPESAGRELLNYFMVAVTIIVVAVPEGLAMSVTLSLAYSMRRMMASNNLVRRMHACETIGAATVICSDKTGTLTLNEMRVHMACIPGLEDGQGDLESLIGEAISVNSTAHLSREGGGELRSLGNPTEGALLLWFADRGGDYVLIRDSFQIETQWTFSTERKFMATLGRTRRESRRVLHVKGAPEIILARCRFTVDGVDLSESQKSALLEEMRIFQKRGMRTLGLAMRFFSPDSEISTEVGDVANDLTWLGFVAIADPVRPDVPEAMKACRIAGIQVKMVTGDNAETAREIGRLTGLLESGEESSGKVLTGPEFALMSEKEAAEAARNLRIMARARPMDKLRLVRLLQECGEVVAVTGDGTNDAPALNHANVGLAMGRTGTSVAKEASDIVLLDDSFTSIVRAVLWGRSLYRNIQKFVLFQLTINVAALCVALLGPFLGVKLPLTVTQMLWVNLIMDTFAALALASEPPDDSVMTMRPRDPEAFIVTPSMARTIFGFGLAFVAVFVVLLLRIGPQPADPTSSAYGIYRYELTELFTVFVLLQFWNLFNARVFGTFRSAFSRLWESRGFLGIAAAVLVGQFLIVQLGGEFFRTVPLHLKDWIRILATSSLVLVVGELARFFGRKNRRM